MQPQAASQQRGRQVAKAGPVAPVNFLLLSCLYAYLSSPFFLQKDCQLRQSPALYHPSSSWVLIQPPKVYFWPTCRKATSCGSFWLASTTLYWMLSPLGVRCTACTASPAGGCDAAGSSAAASVEGRGGTGRGGKAASWAYSWVWWEVLLVE